MENAKLFEQELSLPTQKVIPALVRAVETLIPLIESYRTRNVRKYYSEKSLEFAEYTKLERYKNRVRICDIILPVAKQFLKDCGKIEPEPQDLVDEIE